MIVMAIDPGANGAIAWYNTDQMCTCETDRFHETGVCSINMPDTPGDILSLLSVAGREMRCVCYLENVGSYVSGNSGPASVKFARHCGHLDMALLACGIPVKLVTPQTWMKSIPGARPKEKAERKRWIKAHVQRLHPSLKITLGNADAIALLDYAITQEKQAW